MTHRIHRRATSPLLALGLVGACAGAFAGCKDGGLGGDSCVSTREYFAGEVWTRVVSQSCINCHGPAGIAEEQGANFRLLPSAYPGFLDADFEAMKEAASVSYDGLTALLAKPTAATKHGGGEVFKKDSAEYKIMEELVEQLKDPVECKGEDGANLESVVVATP